MVAKTKVKKSILKLEKKTFNLMEVSSELSEILEIGQQAAYQRIYRAISTGKIKEGLTQYFGEYRLTRQLTKDILNGQIN